jgi:hypothetical protein
MAGKCVMGCDQFSDKSYTVATLPLTANRGDKSVVTDATTPAFNAAPVGGGAVTVPVFWNGTAWMVG